jgi:hypothetical protein
MLLSHMIHEGSKVLANSSLTVIAYKLKNLVFDLGFPLINDFEVVPASSVVERILFLSRVYSPSEAPKFYSKSPHKFHELNNMRAAVVQALKREFGPRFCGGLVPSVFAKQQYPNCIAEVSTHQRNFLNLMKYSLIGVTTLGLHGSTGFKLAEYIACGLCVVTEPLMFEIPVPLIENENLISFTSAEECILACQKLLSDRSLAMEMRKNNIRYYLNELYPPLLIFKKLKTAIIRKINHPKTR